jgi:lipopolysaccharide export system protein LptA
MKWIKVIVLLLIVVNIYAKNSTDSLTIDAINFSAEDTKNLIVFSGDVKMNRVNDKLYANKLVIKLQVNKDTKSKEPILYTATGKVKLEIVTPDKHYKASGDKIIYKPLENKYIILGNGYAEDLKDNRKLYGNKIYIDTITGEAKIDGSKKKPVRFIMQLETKGK